MLGPNPSLYPTRLREFGGGFCRLQGVGYGGEGMYPALRSIGMRDAEWPLQDSGACRGGGREHCTI